MGNRLSPLLANIFMDDLERPALSSRVLYFGRYIDDIFIVENSRATLRQTLGHLNSALPSIVDIRISLAGWTFTTPEYENQNIRKSGQQ